MKPSNKCEVSTVLDKIPELQIVLTAIQQDPGVPELSQRFHDQTRRFIEPQPFAFPCGAFSGETWKQNAEFEVLHEDEPFILGAVATAIATNNCFNRIPRLINGTGMAALKLYGHFGISPQWRYMSSAKN